MIQAVRQCDGPFVELETKPIWILDLRQWMDEQTEATVGAGKKTKKHCSTDSTDKPQTKLTLALPHPVAMVGS